MKALTKEQQKELGDLQANANVAASSLFDAVTTFNDKVAELRKEVGEALEGYNETLSALRDFRDEVVNDIKEYMYERSDKWREGERGQAYDSWKSQWEEAELDDAELEGLPEEEVSFDYVEDRFETVEMELSL